MARIVFLNGQETKVTGAEDEVVQVVRGDHPNPVKLERGEGVLPADWTYITSVGRGPSPVA